MPKKNMRQRVLTGTPIIKCLTIGALEDGGRYLFLLRRLPNGSETVELPSIIVPSGKSPTASIREEFERQTGITDIIVNEIIVEARYNAGSRKRKNFVPVLVFGITARNRSAKPPAPEFAGFQWMKIQDAKNKKLSRRCEWLRMVVL